MYIQGIRCCYSTYQYHVSLYLLYFRVIVRRLRLAVEILIGYIRLTFGSPCASIWQKIQKVVLKQVFISLN